MSEEALRQFTQAGGQFLRPLVELVTEARIAIDDVIGEVGRKLIETILDVSRKKLLAGGILIWSMLTGLTSLATTYAMLVFARLGFAVGEAAVAPTATSWIGDLFPATRRATPLALFMIGVPVGGALAFFFSGPVAQAYGWRATHSRLTVAVPRRSTPSSTRDAAPPTSRDSCSA